MLYVVSRVKLNYVAAYFFSFLGVADNPTFEFPAEIQNGGTARLTCDWSFNRNDLQVKMFRMVNEEEELLGTFKILTHSTKSSIPKLLRVSVSARLLLMIEEATQRSLSIFLDEVLYNEDNGPYWCSIQAVGTQDWYHSTKERITISSK